MFVPKNKIRTQDDEDYIIKEYLNGKSQGQIFRDFNGKFKTRKTISDVLKKYNIKMRKSNDLCYSKTKNHTYFQNINTPNKAYLLGFLSADGWISNTKSENSFQIGLSSIDKDIIELLKQELNSDNKIVVRKGGNKFTAPNNKECTRQDSYQLIVDSPLLYESLKNLGFDTKSIDQHLPVFTETKLYRHWLRGLLDGDGFITTTNINCHIGFMGSIICLSQISMLLFLELGINIKLPKYAKYRNNKTKKYEYSSNKIALLRYADYNDVKLLYKYLYPDNEEFFFLKRKKDKIDEWFKNKNN